MYDDTRRTENGSSEFEKLKKENPDLSDSMIRQLITLRHAPAMFNILNMSPSECSWNISPADMEEHIRRTAAKFLGANEIVMVTVDPVARSTEPICCVWLRSNSKHLVDKSSYDNGQQQVLQPSVKRFSPELTKFAEQFAPLENPDGTPRNRKKLIKLCDNDARDSSVKGLEISLNRMIFTFFDAENRAFQDTYGNGVASPRCDIRCKLIYSKRNDGDRGRLEAIKITKFLSNAAGRRRLRPTRSFNDHRSDWDND